MYVKCIELFASCFEKCGNKIKFSNLIIEEHLSKYGIDTVAVIVIIITAGKPKMIMTIVIYELLNMIHGDVCVLFLKLFFMIKIN